MGTTEGNANVSEVRDILTQAAARFTPQREAVLRALLAHSGSHQSAEEVLHTSREFCSDIGLATVYRTLELFAKLGIVHRLDTAEGQARFELNDSGADHYHHHVICLGCGEIAEFKEDLLDEIEKRAATSTGFQVMDHCLRLYGYCPRCIRDGRGS